MSEEILFADMLNHYSLKTSEVAELLQEMLVNLNKSVAISTDAWQSATADKYLLQVSGVIEHIKKADTSLEEMLVFFNAVKDHEADVQLDELKSQIENATSKE